MVNEVARLRGQTEPLQNRLISRDGADITTVKGMRVGAHLSTTDVDALDVILVPGGQGTRTVIENVEIMVWIDRSRRVVSGSHSFVLTSLFLPKPVC